MNSRRTMRSYHIGIRVTVQSTSTFTKTLLRPRRLRVQLGRLTPSYRSRFSKVYHHILRGGPRGMTRPSVRGITNTVPHALIGWIRRVPPSHLHLPGNQRVVSEATHLQWVLVGTERRKISAGGVGVQPHSITELTFPASSQIVVKFVSNRIEQKST